MLGRKGRVFGFTLVELIVVITIVGILSTVGFVSYSGYLSSARDSNRYSQMTKLSDSLQTYAASKTLPLPDNYIELTSSGSENTIAYQGYVGVDVLETIDYTNGGKDPKDDSYFTYYLSKDRRSLQLMSLMEENTGSLTFLPVNKTTSKYEDRFPKTYGDKLGLLTDTQNIPIQEIQSLQGVGYLDVFHTDDDYKAYFGDSGSVTGTGKILGVSIIGEGRLVGAWDFDTISGITVTDSSGKGNNGFLSGSILPVSVAGMNGNALSFESTNGTVGGLVDFTNNQEMDTGNFTISFWFNPDTQAEASVPVSDILKINSQDTDENNMITIQWRATNEELIKSCRITSITGEIIQVQIKSIVDISIWNHLICTSDGSSLSLYLNGKLEDSISIKNELPRRAGIAKIGAGGPPGTGSRYFDGDMDQLYFYRRPFTSQDVKIIYDATK